MARIALCTIIIIVFFYTFALCILKFSIITYLACIAIHRCLSFACQAFTITIKAYTKIIKKANRTHFNTRMIRSKINKIITALLSITYKNWSSNFLKWHRSLWLYHNPSRIKSYFYSCIIAVWNNLISYKS